MSGEFSKKPRIPRRRQNPTVDTGSNKNTSPPIASTKPIPNYLKAPVSSCHDLCKYGHRHGAESNWRPPVRPKQRGNGGIRGVVLNPELRSKGNNISPPPKDDIFVDKEATFVEASATCDVPREKVFELCDSSSVREINISDEEPSVNSDPVPTHFEDVPVFSAEGSSEDSLSMKVVALHYHDSTCDHDLTAVIPPSDEPVKMLKTKKNAKATQIKGEIVTKNIEREKVDEVSFKPSVTKKRHNVPKGGTVKKIVTPIQPIAKEKRALTLTNKPNIPNNGTRIPKNGEGEAKFPRPVKQAVSVKPPCKPPSKLKKYVGPTSSLLNNPRNSENAKEKTLYVIETKPEVIPLSCNQVKKEHRKGKLYNASTSIKKTASPNYTTKPPLPPHKMTFRRGKVVNVQTETDVPTRLKFRRAKPGNMPEAGTGINKVARKKRENVSYGGIRSTAPTRTPGVALRHQNSPRDKKGAARSLFNHVIEETASKLAETRKSKVKALVGAFETVISLQEKSPGCSSSS